MYQVSPHEFMRAVMSASDHRFTIHSRGDPVDFACMPARIQRHACLTISSHEAMLRGLECQVSPHEFMRAVMSASDHRFTIDTQGDPVDFWTWFVHTLRSDLGGPKKRSVLTQCFQVRFPKAWFSGMAVPQTHHPVVSASDHRFTIDAQGDPVDFWTWFVHTLRSDLGGPKKRSVLTQCFQVRLPKSRQAREGLQTRKVHD